MGLEGGNNAQKAMAEDSLCACPPDLRLWVEKVFCFRSVWWSVLQMQRLGLALSLQEGEGSIPGLGTKIPHAVHYDKKKKQTEKRFKLTVHLEQDMKQRTNKGRGFGRSCPSSPVTRGVCRTAGSYSFVSTQPRPHHPHLPPGHACQPGRLSRGYHALNTWLNMHCSRGWSHTCHVT